MLSVPGHRSTAPQTAPATMIGSGTAVIAIDPGWHPDRTTVRQDPNHAETQYPWRIVADTGPGDDPGLVIDDGNIVLSF